MKQHTTSAILRAMVFIGVLVLAFLPFRSLSAPTWWTTQGVLTTNAPADFAPATLGQLKNFASKAYDEIQTNFVGGAGSVLSAMVSGFANSNNYAPATIGQLKNVGSFFYAQLGTKGFTNPVPWTTSTNDDADFAPATIGQLKRVFDFSFDQDTDHDGMADWWERMYGLDPDSTNDVSSDSDNDGLTNTQEFQHRTDPTLADTDGDGVNDGDEVDQGTNPLAGSDTDGDGLSDDLEIVLGTSGTNADTDQDWASDGYEIAQETDPLDPDDTPLLSFQINSDEPFVNTTNLTLYFTGLVAEGVSIGTTVDAPDATTNAFSPVVSYQLPFDSNGFFTLYAKLLRNAGSESISPSAASVLDTLPPVLAITNPVDGTVTSRRWVRVEGVVSDTVSAVHVMINDDYPDLADGGAFAKDQIALLPGTNVIAVTAADWVGNAVTQETRVILDTSLDTQAPAVTLNLEPDYEVVGGTTNVLDRTTFGSNQNLYVDGIVDDDTAEIELFVSNASETNGPFGANVVGTQVSANVSLFIGTNILTAIAGDLAGNSSTSTYTVVRDEGFQFQLTNPVPYQVMDGLETYVEGVASPAFIGSTITVNGIATELHDRGSYVDFRTVSAVPLNEERTTLSATAELDGRSYHDPSPVVTFGVKFWRKREDFSANGFWQRQGFQYVAVWSTSFGFSEESWQGGYHHTSQVQSDSACTNYPSGCGYEYVNISTQVTETVAPQNQKYGLEATRSFANGPLGAVDTSSFHVYGGQLNVMRDGPETKEVAVILGFGGMKIGDEDADPTNITFRGHSGFLSDGFACFPTTMKNGSTFFIQRNDFEWTGNEALSFESITNDILSVELLEDGSTAEEYVYIKDTPEMPNLSARLDPNNLPDTASWRLLIEYRREQRDDEEYYPSASTWTVLPATSTWDIASAFGSDFRGGKATLWCVYQGQLIEKVFHIRGNNPSEAAVETEITSTPWYAKPVAKWESNEPQQGRYYAQFNTVGPFGPNEDDYKWCPNFGGPNGWGIFQLDTPSPTEQQLWSWTANVAGGKAHLATCYGEAEDWIADQESQQQTEDPSQPLTNEVFTFNGIDFKKGTARTPTDACTIGRYHGDATWAIYWKNATTNTPGSWEIHASTYVNSVCGEVE